MAFQLALIQMKVVGGQKALNLAHARSLIAQAASDGADVVLLPEAMDLGWTDTTGRAQAEAIPDGEACRQLAQAASAHGIYVCAGLTESDGSHVFNTAVLLDRNGQLLSRYRKLNELTIGHASYDQGDRLSVVHTELGSFGLMICADACAHGHVLSRSLCYMGADVILSPCAWAMPDDHDNHKEPYGETWRNAYTPVARDFSVWIAGASNIGRIDSGPWKGSKCIGCSLVIGPDGQEVIQGPYGEEAETILHVHVQTRERPARGSGWNRHLGQRRIAP